MKNRIGIIVLVLICVGLGIATISIKRQAAVQQAAATDQIVNWSNKWIDTDSKWGDEKRLTATLYKDIDSQKKTFEKALSDLTNSYTQVSENLIKSEALLKSSQETVTKLEAKTADLEAQNAELDQRSLKLSAEITNLTAQITDTRRKLAASEGDRAFLEKELKRLMTEKADLERQFNDLAVLKAQVSRLKEEMAIARRVEWIRQGIFASADQKGAQKLMQGLNAPSSSRASRPPNYDLNVEVSADGKVRVIPPATNSPAGAVPPGR